MVRYFFESFDDDELRRFGKELEIVKERVVMKEKVSGVSMFCFE